MKYIAIQKIRGEEFTREFGLVTEAVDWAEYEWKHLCDEDKKHTEAFYILESVNPDEDAEDHYDGDIVYDMSTIKHAVVARMCNNRSMLEFFETLGFECVECVSLFADHDTWRYSWKDFQPDGQMERFANYPRRRFEHDFACMCSFM